MEDHLGEIMEKTAFDNLMEEFGTIKNLCEKIGVKYVTAYAWKMRNGIPKKWHSAIIEASEGRMNESLLG